MDIRVSGHQVATGDALRQHVEDRLQGIATKYFSRAISAEVTFGKGPHDAGFSCDIVAHVMKGLVLKGRNDAHDAHRAFDGAAEKIETQLRRYMRRLKDRHAAETVAVEEANGYDNAGYTLFAEPVGDEEVAEAPLIIAETRVDVPDASVSDAVMMLDLRNTAALLFRNAGTGAYNMVYRRGDGTIGWVEPQRAGWSMSDGVGSDWGVLLRPEAIRVAITVGSKKALFAAIGQLAQPMLGAAPTDIAERLAAREKLGSTGFGGGVAIPHAKLPGLADPVGIFVRLAQPLDYRAVDDVPVDCVFALLSPVDAGSVHLQVLAQVSRRLRDPSFVAKLRGAGLPDALYALFTADDARDAA